MIQTEPRCTRCGNRLLDKNAIEVGQCFKCFALDQCDDEEDEVTDCPKCNQTYDDADADFLICSKCGWNVNTGKYDLRKVQRNQHEL